MMAPLPIKIAPKIRAMIRLLGSDQEKETLAAVKGITRTLSGAGLTLHDLADAVEEPRAPRAPRATRAQPAPPKAPNGTGMMWSLDKRITISRMLRSGISAGLFDAREEEFATDVIGQMMSPSRPRNLTQGQAEWVNKLLAKIAGAAQ